MRWVKAMLAFDDPARAFAVLAFVFGVTILAVYPPFQGPDEQAHFYRAYEISEGRLIARFDGQSQLRDLPLSLRRTALRYVHLHFQPQRKTSRAQILDDFATPLDAEVRGPIPGESGRYVPIAYAPHAVAIAVGRLFGAGPLMLLYLGRMGGLIFGVLGIALALRLTGALAHTMMLIALLPMMMCQMASITADTMLFVGCFLMTALSLRALYVGLDRWCVVGLLAASACVGAIKIVYAAIPMLLLAVPPRQVGGRARLLGILSGAALVGWTAYDLWLRVAASDRVGPVVRGPELAVPAIPALDSVDRVATFTALAFANLSRKAYWYLETFIGKPGYLDTQLAEWIVWTLLVALVVVALLESPPRPLPLGMRAIAAFATVLITVTISWAMYRWYWQNGAPDNIEGIQGRYFLPYAPTIALVFAAIGVPLKWTVAWRTRAVALIAGFGLVAMIATMIDRYYG